MFILIPAYEPDDRLPELVAELLACEPELGVLVVDDGSGPAFAEVFARAARAGAEVLRHPSNLGKGVALKTGFSHIVEHHPGEHVVTADADGQHLVADILAVARDVSTAVASGSEGAGGAGGAEGSEGSGGDRTMILGCRGFDGEVPARSRFGNAISRALFRAAAGWRLSDTQTGLRGVPHAMLPWLLEVPGERFEYEQRVLLGLRRAGFSAREQRIATVYLAGNASSHFRPVLDSVRVMLPVLVFAASSFLGFLVDTAALFLLFAATGALVPSIIGARVLSAGVNFWVNRRVVFLRRGRGGLARQATGYALLAIVLLASNIVWMSYLVDAGVPLWIAKIATELVLFVTGYRVQKHAVFGGSGQAGPPESAPESASESRDLEARMLRAA